MLKKFKVLLLLCMLVFICFAFYDSLFVRSFDIAVRESILHLRNDFLNIIVLFFTHAGDAKVLGVLCVLGVIVLLLRKKWWNAILLFASISVSYGLNMILKNAFERERPINHRLIQEDGFSFPSGNAMVGTTFYLFSAFLLYQRFQKPWILWIGAILPFFLGISRIYVGVHYPSDILAGFSIGILLCISFIWMVSKSAKIKRTIDPNDKEAAI